ncbi:MAG TPA: hypothetical protein DEF51_20915, partial [Myxococcales bacterium]|nr:hypothetical protein [Myxococcales bacterium]
DPAEDARLQAIAEAVSPQVGPASEVVRGDDLEDGLRRLFEAPEGQRVDALQVRYSMLAVDVRSDNVTIIVLDGREPPPGVTRRGEGWWVLPLGRPRHGMTFFVGRRARALMVTRDPPVQLALAPVRRGMGVRGAPEDSRFELRATLDGAELDVDDDDRRRLAIPSQLSAGRHRVRVELVRRVDGDVIASAEEDYFEPLEVELTLRAGMAPRCFRLTDDAVARPTQLYPIVPGTRLWSDGMPGEDGHVRDAKICAWAPMFSQGGVRSAWLSESLNDAAVHLTLRVEPLPNWLMPAATGLVFLLALALLAWGFRPRLRRRVTHVAWSDSPAGGYREPEARRWKVVALERVGASITGGHTVSGDGDFEPAHPVVVAPPPPSPTALQVERFPLDAGAVVVDGTRWIAFLDARTARRVERGAAPRVPTGAEVEAAKTVGFIGEIVRPPKSHALAFAVMAAWAAATAALGYVPIAVAGSRDPVEPYLGGVLAWAVAASLGLIVVAVVARVGRRV